MNFMSHKNIFVHINKSKNQRQSWPHALESPHSFSELSSQVISWPLSNIIFWVLSSCLIFSIQCCWRILQSQWMWLDNLPVMCHRIAGLLKCCQLVRGAKVAPSDVLRGQRQSLYCPVVTLIKRKPNNRIFEMVFMRHKICLVENWKVQVSIWAKWRHMPTLFSRASYRG